MSATQIQVELFLGDGFDIWLHSYFVTGLIQLAQAGAIRLRVMRGNDLARCATIQNTGYPLLILKCTAGTGDRSQILGFDPRDQSDVWQSMALDGCDMYFKRSFHALDTDRLSSAHRLKVRPINPMFATWQNGATGWTVRMYAAFVQKAVQQITAHCPSRDARQLMLRNCYALASLSPVDHYEDTPVGAKRPQVLFQTRLWNPAEEKGDWVDPCNQHRVNMVRVLRAKLGGRLVGGLIREPYAEQHYPDLLSNLTANAKAKRPEFIRLCRQFLIRVNIKALFDATPYSLGETLAANNCLVSENIRNTFATPLVEGRHYVGFTTSDECADRCLELLDSPAKSAQLREQAYEYYRASVQPAAAMRMYLHQALSLP